MASACFTIRLFLTETELRHERTRSGCVFEKKHSLGKRIDNVCRALRAQQPLFFAIKEQHAHHCDDDAVQRDAGFSHF